MKLNLSLWIKITELLEKYNEIRDKVKNTIKKGFHSEPVYNEKYLRTKIKSFYFNLGKNYYSQVF